MAILVGLTAGYFARSDIRLKSSAYDLSKEIQGAALDAIKKSKICRMTFEEDKQTYRVQEFVPPPARPKTTDREALQKWEDLQRERDALSPEERINQTRLDRGSFKTVSTRKLRDPVILAEFYTTRSSDDDAKVKNSKNYEKRDLLFYPTGEMDEALLVLSDGHDHFFSLLTNPLTGRVTARVGEVKEQEWKNDKDRVK